MLSCTLFVLIGISDDVAKMAEISGDMRMIEFRDGVGHGGKFHRRPRVEAAIWATYNNQPPRLCWCLRISRNRVYASIHYLAANPEQENAY